LRGWMVVRVGVRVPTRLIGKLRSCGGGEMFSLAWFFFWSFL
jgi:hypothetical protein